MKPLSAEEHKALCFFNVAFYHKQLSVLRDNPGELCGKISLVESFKNLCSEKLAGVEDIPV